MTRHSFSRTFLLALVFTSPAALKSQAPPRPAIDTLSPFALLPGVTIIRTEIIPRCIDCEITYVTRILGAGTNLELKSVSDLPQLWSLLPPLADTAPKDALRSRLVMLFALTYLPDYNPRLIKSAKDLKSFFEKELTLNISIESPVDSLGAGRRTTVFTVGTLRGLHRIRARTNAANQLVLSDSLLMCYLCP